MTIVFFIIIGCTYTNVFTTWSETTNDHSQLGYSDSTDDDICNALESSDARGQSFIEVVPATPPDTAFIGQQDVTLNITLKSLFIDDDNDQNGDNVLYNISILGLNPSTIPGWEDNLMKLDCKTQKFFNYSKKVFNWDNDKISNDGPGSQNYMLYSAGNFGSWKQVMNLSNSFLDEDNEGTIDPEEYWSVQDGTKEYGSLMFDILGDAEPGHYRMKLKVSYEYQESQVI